MYLGFLFRPTKLDFLLISRFSCVACQTVHRQIKTNISRAIFSYGENWNSGALENQLRSFQGRSLNTSFFSRFRYVACQTVHPEKKLMYLWLDLAMGKIEAALENQLPSFRKILLSCIEVSFFSGRSLICSLFPDFSL